MFCSGLGEAILPIEFPTELVVQFSFGQTLMEAEVRLNTLRPKFRLAKQLIGDSMTGSLPER